MADRGNKEFLKAGQLDTPIDVYSYTNTQNEFGEISQSSALLKTIWAKLITTAIKGTQEVEDSVIVGESKINFLVRWDDDLQVNSATISPSEHFTIKYLNKFWKISSMEYNGRGKGILIRCYFTDDN
jgi:head-tail adaptor